MAKVGTGTAKNSYGSATLILNHPKTPFPPGPVDGAPRAAAGRVGPVGGRTPRIGRNLARPARPARLPMAAGRLAQGGGQARLLEPLAALALLFLALHARLLGLDLGEALGGGGGGRHHRLRPVGLLGRTPRALLLLSSAVLLARLRLRVLPGLSFNALLRKKENGIKLLLTALRIRGIFVRIRIRNSLTDTVQ